MNQLLGNISVIFISYLVYRMNIDKIIKDQAQVMDYNKLLQHPELINNYAKLITADIYNSRFGQYLKDFIAIMEKNFDQEDLILFYNNINSLEIVNKKFINSFSTRGVYNPFKNEINLLSTTEVETIFHELFHMASCLKINDEIYCGFYQLKRNEIVLGKALNEGYTEVLHQRYFPSSTKIYIYEKTIASQLELIIGSKKMSSLYLNANLNGLIMELAKYVPIPKIMQFLSAFDFVMNNFTKPYYLTSLKETLITKLTYINLFLFKAYALKMGEEYQNKKITLEEYVKRISDYINNLVIELKTKYRYLEINCHNKLEILLNQIIKEQNLEFDLKEIKSLARKLN